MNPRKAAIELNKRVEAMPSFPFMMVDNEHVPRILNALSGKDLLSLQETYTVFLNDPIKLGMIIKEIHIRENYSVSRECELKQHPKKRMPGMPGFNLS